MIVIYNGESKKNEKGKQIKVRRMKWIKEWLELINGYIGEERNEMKD